MSSKLLTIAEFRQEVKRTALEVAKKHALSDQQTDLLVKMSLRTFGLEPTCPRERE